MYKLTRRNILILEINRQCWKEPYDRNNRYVTMHKNDTVNRLNYMDLNVAFVSHHLLSYFWGYFYHPTLECSKI